MEAFVASWMARGFAATTIGNDAGVLERMLAALGCPAWEATPEDVDRMVGELAAAGWATSTRRNYLQCSGDSSGSWRSARPAPRKWTRY